MTGRAPEPVGGRGDGRPEETWGATGDADGVPGVVRLRPPTTAAVARSQVRRLLRGRPAAPSDAIVDDILIVVTELITNAFRHGGGMTAFDAFLDDGFLVVRVTDASTAPPRTVPRDDPAAPGGFGWPLVQRLSRHVTVTAVPGGKTIQVVLAAGPTA
ncbi:ATP-binding protein [Streptomyces sp. NPDC093094]|uniref:ATP-binding protein n=1 Tax=Streptomyces sp. NPDC093094 TaxID=3366026 RepID=UPI0037F9CC12